MQTYLIMIEIVTFNKELKEYYLLKGKNTQNVQAVIDGHLRSRGATERDFDYSMTMIERVAEHERLVLEQYIDYYQ